MRKGFSIRIDKPSLAFGSRAWFCIYNTAVSKTYDNNVLHQSRDIKLPFGYKLSIERKRYYEDVPNIEGILANYGKRIGSWK